MKASLNDLMKRMPGARTKDWPDGEPFTLAMRHGSMSVEVFAPSGTDTQQPHDQDELYFVVSGSADFVVDGKKDPVATGDVLFVPAQVPHHFEQMSTDFITWVVFWGPKGGEKAEG